MGYLHISNLYKDQRILDFKRLFALEKIHGTSANISWTKGQLGLFSGGEKHDRFAALFDTNALAAMFQEKFGDSVDATIYGEAYGGRQQGMSATYGPDLRFVAFDVKIDGKWLNVEQAAGFCQGAGPVMRSISGGGEPVLTAIEFVDYNLIPATLEAIDAERDRPSTQALRNAVADKIWDREPIREGVVLRPPYEVTLNNGERLIAKHKRDEFRETLTPRVVTDPAKLAKLEGADAIVNEWVTIERMSHVIDQLIRDREYKRAEMSDIPALIRLMQEDIYREAGGEVTPGKEVSRAIGTKTVQLFKKVMDNHLREAAQ